MFYGYMGRILIVDLTSGSFREETISESTARQFLGGYGLGARILWDRVPRGADPLGPENVLGFLSGPLTGTKSVTSCRFTVVGKSPLTGLWGDSNCGGHFAEPLKACGYDGVFFTGRSPRPAALNLTDKGPELRDAAHLWGMNTRETEAALRSESGGRRMSVVCIGPAGEKQSLIAALITEGARAAGRSGLGAVMGSKNLKAFTVGGALQTTMARPDEVAELNKRMRAELKAKKEPARTFMKYGTSGLVRSSVDSQDAPIQNWKGVNEAVFDAEKKGARISDEQVLRYQTRKYACGSCPIGCGGVVDVPDGPWEMRGVHKPEYETLISFGALCLNDNVESIIACNEICNLYGLDTISAGATMAFAMECFEQGILTSEDTGGLDLSWGDEKAVVEVLKMMAERRGIGAVLADGSRKAAERIGKGAERFAMHVGGQELPMHDPRLAPGFGTAYTVDPAPGRHTHGGTHGVEFGRENPRFAHMGLPKVGPYDFDNKGELHRIYSAWQHVISSVGICWFGSFCVYYPVVDLLNAVTGWDTDVEELIETGTRILLMRHAFNLREGFRPDRFRLPARVGGDPPLDGGPLQGVSIDIDTLRREAYKALGCDEETGLPGRETLDRLGLSDLMGVEGIRI